jgi:hypothetical protein
LTVPLPLNFLLISMPFAAPLHHEGLALFLSLFEGVLTAYLLHDGADNKNKEQDGGGPGHGRSRSHHQ